MAKVTYVGPKAKVQVVHPLRTVVVERDKSIEVADAVAVGLQENAHFRVELSAPEDSGEKE